jgi:hypothetical protein
VIATLICIECEESIVGQASGWQGHLVDLGDDGGDEVVYYCPTCAKREFSDSSGETPRDSRPEPWLG